MWMPYTGFPRNKAKFQSHNKQSRDHHSRVAFHTQSWTLVQGQQQQRQVFLGLLLLPEAPPSAYQASVTILRTTGGDEGIPAFRPATFHQRDYHISYGTTRLSTETTNASTRTSGPSSIKCGFAGSFGSGRGGNAKMSVTNPFAFFAQVSKRYGKSFRSNNVCLLLLPCPQPLCELLLNVIVSLRYQLLLGGDIEKNPGPIDQTISEQLKIIAEDIQEIKKGKAVTNQKLIAIEKKLEKISGLETQLTECARKVAELERNLATMTSKLDELENRSRRSNLIPYGVKEQEDETTDTLHETVTKTVFEDVLGITKTDIERIHRLGRPSKDNETRPRPIILKFLDYRDKLSILKQCSKLKDSGFSIGEDFSLAVMNVRKKLWDRTKEHRDRKEKVSLVYDKVKINGQLFMWDSESSDIVPVKPKNKDQNNTRKRITRSKRQ
ncbi:uncharacterized protein LOC144105034 [Amblyomma americanum]